MTAEERAAASEQKRKNDALTFYGCVVGFGRFVSAKELCRELGFSRAKLDAVKKYYRQNLARHHVRVLVVYPAIGPKAAYGVFGSRDQAEEYLGANVDRAEILLDNLANTVAPVYRKQYGETEQLTRLERMAEAVGVKVFADADSITEREEVA